MTKSFIKSMEKWFLNMKDAQLDTDDEFAQKLIEMGRPLMLNEGYIALQAESHPVEFRNIELLKLEQQFKRQVHFPSSS